VYFYFAPELFEVLRPEPPTTNAGIEPAGLIVSIVITLFGVLMLKLEPYYPQDVAELMLQADESNN
jgi:hypothetical protein